MNDSGYIKIYRSIMDWEWYSDPPTLCLFVQCLLDANWKDGRFRGREIKRGSFVTSLAKLSQETGLTFQQTRTALKHLLSTGELTKVSTPEYTVITVQNYDRYQDTNKAPNKQPTSDQQTTNKQLTTIEERKNRKKERNNSSIVSKATYSAEIVDYLNEKLGTRYKPTTPKTLSLIEARLNEGFTVEDFKKVIDVKTEEWGKDEKMSKFLRPETLFSNKFEGYLNQFSQNDEVKRNDDEDRAKLERWYDDIFGV